LFTVLFYGFRELGAETMKNRTWSKTKVQGLLRHRGGTYYARLYVAGKEKWLSLDTTVLEIAKAKFTDEKAALAEARKTGWEPKAGMITMQAAIDAYRLGLELRVGIKESTRAFYGWQLDAIVKSWPELPNLDVRHVTETQCKEWAKKFSSEYSTSYYNSAILVFANVFQAAITAGAIYRNPAHGLEHRTVTQKSLVLPSRDEFHQIVEVIRGGKHRTAQHAADLIEFLAYTGCRISESRRVHWGDCDLVAEKLTVKGDPDTATKNWKIRTIPFIAEAKLLLERIRGQRTEISPQRPVFLVGDVRGAFAKVAKALDMTKYSHHDLRHLFATTCIEAGVDIVTVSRWLGHSDGGALAMRTYGHLRDEHSTRSAKLVSFAVPPTL
jgi:integrase